MKTFKDWKEIRDWAKDNGLDNLAKRMQLNNDCWASSGEFVMQSGSQKLRKNRWILQNN